MNMNRRQFLGMVAALSATSLMSKEVKQWTEQITIDDIHKSDLVLAFKDSEDQIIAMGLIECKGPASQGEIEIGNADFDVIKTGTITKAEIINGDYVVCEIPVQRSYDKPSSYHHGIYMTQIHVMTADVISLFNFTIRG